jgi:hypothetical protein
MVVKNKGLSKNPRNWVVGQAFMLSYGFIPLESRKELLTFPFVHHRKCTVLFRCRAF